MGSFTRKVLIIVIFIIVMEYIYSQAFGASMIGDMNKYIKNKSNDNSSNNPPSNSPPEQATQEQSKNPNFIDIGYTKSGNVILQDFNNGNVKIQKSQQDGTIIKTYTYPEWVIIRKDIADYSTISKEYTPQSGRTTKHNKG